MRVSLEHMQAVRDGFTRRGRQGEKGVEKREGGGVFGIFHLTLLLTPSFECNYLPLTHRPSFKPLVAQELKKNHALKGERSRASVGTVFNKMCVPHLLFFSGCLFNREKKSIP